MADSRPLPNANIRNTSSVPSNNNDNRMRSNVSNSQRSGPYSTMMNRNQANQATPPRSLVTAANGLTSPNANGVARPMDSASIAAMRQQSNLYHSGNNGSWIDSSAFSTNRQANFTYDYQTPYPAPAAMQYTWRTNPNLNVYNTNRAPSSRQQPPYYHAPSYNYAPRSAQTSTQSQHNNLQAGSIRMNQMNAIHNNPSIARSPLRANNTTNSSIQTTSNNIARNTSKISSHPNNSQNNNPSAVYDRNRTQDRAFNIATTVAASHRARTAYNQGYSHMRPIPHLSPAAMSKQSTVSKDTADNQLKRRDLLRSITDLEKIVVHATQFYDTKSSMTLANLISPSLLKLLTPPLIDIVHGIDVVRFKIPPTSSVPKGSKNESSNSDGSKPISSKELFLLCKDAVESKPSQPTANELWPGVQKSYAAIQCAHCNSDTFQIDSMKELPDLIINQLLPQYQKTYQNTVTDWNDSLFQDYPFFQAELEALCQHITERLVSNPELCIPYVDRKKKQTDNLADHSSSKVNKENISVNIQDTKQSGKRKDRADSATDNVDEKEDSVLADTTIQTTQETGKIQEAHDRNGSKHHEEPLSRKTVTEQSNEQVQKKAKTT